MNISALRARIVAVLVGVGLLLLEAVAPLHWYGDDEFSAFLSDLTIYSILGFILGLVWPREGWRLGLYLFAALLFALGFGAFLAGEQPVIWRAQAINLLGYLMILVGACISAAIGGLIWRRSVRAAESDSSRKE